LKKCWFEDYRFSEDLDFTARQQITENELKEALDRVSDEVSNTSGLPINKESTTVRQTRDFEKQESYKATIYFVGPRNDTRNPLRIKFDISHYEKIALPVIMARVFHPYSDAHQCECEIPSYSIEEIIAEKLRALLQRSRARDYYDIWYILKNNVGDIQKEDVIDAFKKKADYKNVLFGDIDSIIGNEKYGVIQPSWSAQLDHQLVYTPKLEKIRDEFNQLVTSLFKLDIPDLETKILHPEKYLTNPNILSIREKIIQAGKSLTLIKLVYEGAERLVEPYSFRYRNGREYFFGYNLIGGSSSSSIRSFDMKKIQQVELTNKTYKPKWPVEF
jgi:predicted nucleotidyltransferase component of viral defense system